MVLIAMRTIVVQSAQCSRMAVRTAIPLGFPGRLNDGRAIVLALRSACRVPQGTVIGPWNDFAAPSAVLLERQPLDRTPQPRQPARRAPAVTEIGPLAPSPICRMLRSSTWPMGTISASNSDATV